MPSAIWVLSFLGESFILLGEKRYWGQGIGTAMMQQAVAPGFQGLGLNRVMLTISVPNEKGVSKIDNENISYCFHFYSCLLDCACSRQ